MCLTFVIVKMKKTVNIDKIKKLHDIARHLIALNDECATLKLSPEIIKSNNNTLQELEFEMQREWGFEQKPECHTWWLEHSNCKCPKLDNKDPVFFGAGKIINSSCPIHNPIA